MRQQTVLVTGGTGFVGSHVCQRLIEQGCKVRVPTRHPTSRASAGWESVQTGDLTHFANWNQLLRGVDAVVHLVARTHVTNEFGRSAMQAYRATNVDITRRLARAAEQAGVRHLVYMSSIKAVGNSSTSPLCEDAHCNPVDSYGDSKLEAEQTVRQLLHGSACTYTILRPPLVYGPGVKGNFLRLLNLIQRGVPLPRISNQRSMVHVENLVDVILLTLEHTAAKNQILHIADSTPISTTELVIHMATGLDRMPRFVPLPQVFLTPLGKAIGRQEEMRRLVDSLIVSHEKATTLLNWKPRIATPHGVEQTSRAFSLRPWTTGPSSTEPPTARGTRAA